MAEVRRTLGSRLARAGRGADLLRALALGDRSGLEPAVREAFARLGLAHLLAVSGLHLGLVGTLTFAGMRRGSRACRVSLHASMCAFRPLESPPSRRAPMRFSSGGRSRSGARSCFSQWRCSR